MTTKTKSLTVRIEIPEVPLAVALAREAMEAASGLLDIYSKRIDIELGSDARTASLTIAKWSPEEEAYAKRGDTWADCLRIVHIDGTAYALPRYSGEPVVVTPRDILAAFEAAQAAEAAQDVIDETPEEVAS